MSKKSKLLDTHAKILKIAQDEDHEELEQAANELYDTIATLDEDPPPPPDDENHPKKPGNP